MQHVRLRLSCLLGLMVGCGTATDPIGPGLVDGGRLPGAPGSDAGPGGTLGGGSTVGGSLGGGTTGGGTLGGGTLGGGSTTPVPVPNEDGLCEVVKVDSGPVVPDMLIVLDRSGSMKPPNVNCKGYTFNIITGWTDPRTYVCGGIDCNDPANANNGLCGGTQITNRWDPSVSGIKAVTGRLQDRVSFGLMLFPDANSSGRNVACEVGDVSVPVGLNTAQPIAQVLDNTQPGGGTPTGPALERALSLIEQKSYSIDQVPPPQYVLLVTDGQPTCPAGNGSNATPEDRARAIQAITNLRTAGAPTYVLGYDAASDEAFARSLDEFAVAGGTERYRPVADENSLVTEIERITQRVASCSYQLASKPADPSYVLIKLDGRQLDLGNPDGWRINERNIEILGAACQTLQDGMRHNLDVTVQCEPVPPLG